MPVETSAAVLHAFREPQRVERVELRDPGPGEALIAIHAAGVCHSDVGQADGDWGYPLPAVLGHEGAGVVEALGPGVDGLDVGQKVVLSLAPGCAACRHCAVGRPILCQESLAAMGAGTLTTGPSPIRGVDGPIAAYSLLACFAGRAVVAARSCIPLLDGVPADVASLVGCAVVTGAGAAIETIEIEAGSRGAVVGAGGVGVNAIMGARLRGAAEIVAFDASPERLERAATFGATSGVDVGDAGLLSSLRDRAPREGFDWAIVTVGVGGAIRLGIDLVRPGGVTCVVGLMPEGQPVSVDMLDLVTYEKRIVGSAYGTLDPRVLVPRLLALYLDGRLPLDRLVSDRFPLEGINEAFDLSRRAGGLRPVLEARSALVTRRDGCGLPGPVVSTTMPCLGISYERARAVSSFTRSQLVVRGGAALVTAGGLSALLAPGAAAGAEEDLALVRLASAAEVLAVDFYTRGLDSGLFKGAERRYLARALFNEQEHLAALNAALADAGDTATQAGYGDFEFSFPDGTFAGREAFAEVGVTLETAFVGAYLGIVEAVGSADIRNAAARIAACEGRHLGALASLGGLAPVGNSFPALLDIEQASEALAPFLG